MPKKPKDGKTVPLCQRVFKPHIRNESNENEERNCEGGAPQWLPRDLPEMKECLEEQLQPTMLTKEYLSTAPHAEIAKHLETIFERHANGEPLGDILKLYGFNRWKLRNLLLVNSHLYPRYNMCRDSHAERLIDETIEISDDNRSDTLSQRDNFGNERPNTDWINRSKLRCEMRRWKYSIYLHHKLLRLDDTGDLKAKAAYITKMLMSNEISADQSKQLLEVLNLEAKINEFHDLAKRIEMLEDKAKAYNK